MVKFFFVSDFYAKKEIPFLGEDMAKVKVIYPNGVTRVKYKTTIAGPSEQTPGKVKQSAFANRVYYKPSLRKVVIRHPGVLRVSEDVRKINEQLRALAGKPQHPSVQCGGMSWAERIKCLKVKMKEAIKPVTEIM